jgi:hypothetical protein
MPVAWVSKLLFSEGKVIGFSLSINVYLKTDTVQTIQVM